MTSGAGRKTGWPDRTTERRLRPPADPGASEPIDDDYFECYGDLDEARVYDDPDDHAWKTPFMRPMAVFVGGLVHVAIPRRERMACGLEYDGGKPLLGLSSSDEVTAWSIRNAGDSREVTCLGCVARILTWRLG